MDWRLEYFCLIIAYASGLSYFAIQRRLVIVGRSTTWQPGAPKKYNGRKSTSYKSFKFVPALLITVGNSALSIATNFKQVS